MNREKTETELFVKTINNYVHPKKDAWIGFVSIQRKWIFIRRQKRLWGLFVNKSKLKLIWRKAAKWFGKNGRWLMRCVCFILSQWEDPLQTTRDSVILNDKMPRMVPFPIIFCWFRTNGDMPWIIRCVFSDHKEGEGKNGSFAISVRLCIKAESH